MNMHVAADNRRQGWL